jgi:hypothetical protein
MELVLNTYGVSLNRDNEGFIVSHKHGKQRLPVDGITNLQISKGAQITSDAVMLAIENEIEIDCSLTPANHLYGKKTTNLQIPYRIQLPNGIIKEFPITTFKLLGNNIGFTGGGYFRLYPYSLIKQATSRLRILWLIFILAI